MLQHDRKIVLSIGDNRKSVNWLPSSITLTGLYEKLSHPVRGKETLAQYMDMPKAKQDALKDVGGFVAGSLIGNRRKKANVKNRSLITLDFDSLPKNSTTKVVEKLDDLRCGYCAYSTQKHTPEKPRLRVLIPLSRDVLPDEYEPLARYVAYWVGINCVDPTCFNVASLMYFPRCSADSEYFFKYNDKEALNVDTTLDLLTTTFGDWHNIAAWYRAPSETKKTERLAARQGNPEEKPGIVGAFCRAYNIYSAIETFLPEEYTYSGTDTERLTYTKGSTYGGAVIYDNGIFLYSHHATDPCSEKLVNAFDLVRLHKFGELDVDSKEGTPVNRLPSYAAMCNLASNDKNVKARLIQQVRDTAAQDFAELETDSTDKNSADFLSELELDQKTGRVKNTINNVLLLLENSPGLKDKFALNEFTEQYEVLADLPWGATFTKKRAWTDADSHGLYWYLEKEYGITGTSKIDSALAVYCEKHKFNELRDYIKELQWDGVSRLETLLIDYLGAKDTRYVRTVTKKAFTAAVARVLEPGIKYDTMLILSGKQGVGKSTLLQKMSKGFFTDSIRTFEGKDAIELLQGAWLVEVGELDAFRKTDENRMKQFLSTQCDKLRPAYGKFTKNIPRQCVFFGTTNSKEFLRDSTGGRRYFPVDVSEQAPKKNIWKDLDAEIDMIWAEAKMRWESGETIYLSEADAVAAQEEQEAHREISPREGLVREFLSKPVPVDWDTWEADKRALFWSGAVEDELILVPRSTVCVLEIWIEALGGNKSNMKRFDSVEINNILRSLPDWESVKKVQRVAYYGPQRCYKRKQTE